MRKVVFALVLACSATTAQAGAANTQIQCQSPDGKLTLVGEVPGDLAEFTLTVTLEGKSFRLFSRLNPETKRVEENASIEVVDSLKEGVFTLVARSLRTDESYSYLKLYALPSSVSVRHMTNGQASSFRGKLETRSKAANDNQPLSEEVGCLTRYET